jgi:4-amino-4-deoxy-L-arabinose transferase-like glycosyltransferase
MQENANAEGPTSNFECRSDEGQSVLTSTFDVRGSTFNVRIFFQLTIILLAGLFIYGYRLGGSPLDRTEPFRALVAHQMVNGGDWLVPRLYGEVYLRKPPLIYWIEAGTEKLIGRGNEFVWRLPSAVGSALLAVFVAWWAGRWFGAAARLPSGFACLALVALWDQNRSADIDALNTAFAIVTSLCVLELICGPGRYRAAWALGLGLSLGATLLLKGPGGLPQIIGAIIGPAIFLRNWKIVRKASIAIGLLVGFAVFAAYVVSAKIAMQHAGIVPDKTGWYEVIEKIFLHGWGRRALAMLMPAELIAFALPVSVVLPFAILLIRKVPGCDPRFTRLLAILGTLAASVVIWMIDGNDNPRYEYVMLPLLAPVVGLVWSDWGRRAFWFDQTLLGVCCLICGANGLVLLKMPPAGADFVLLLAGFGLSLSAAILLAVAFARFEAPAAKAAGPVTVLLVMLLAMPMGERKNVERRKKSASNASAALRQVIGNSPRVLAAGMVRDMPEVFFYANVDAQSFGEFGLLKLAETRGGHWVVLEEKELTAIQKQIPGAFPNPPTKLPMPDPRDRIFVGWYDPPANANTKLNWKPEKQAESDE